MTAVISLHADPDQACAAARVVQALERHLIVDAEIGADGSWELRFADSHYAPAHAQVVEALDATDPDWSSALTIDYVLTL